MASTYQPHQINSKLTDQQRDATAEGDVPLLARLPPQQSNLRRHRAWGFHHLRLRASLANLDQRAL